MAFMRFWVFVTAVIMMVIFPLAVLLHFNQDPRDQWGSLPGDLVWDGSWKTGALTHECPASVTSIGTDSCVYVFSFSAMTDNMALTEMYEAPNKYGFGHPSSGVARYDVERARASLWNDGGGWLVSWGDELNDAPRQAYPGFVQVFTFEPLG